MEKLLAAQGWPLQDAGPNALSRRLLAVAARAGDEMNEARWLLVPEAAGVG